jgi:hypothetical protein
LRTNRKNEIGLVFEHFFSAAAQKTTQQKTFDFLGKTLANKAFTWTSNAFKVTR